MLTQNLRQTAAKPARPGPGAPRPADVLRAHEQYVFDAGNLTPEETALALKLTRTALAQLPQPAIVTNRHYADSATALALGQFTTLFFHPDPTDIRLRDLEQLRDANRQAGIYGEGSDAGHTVFGGLVFPARDPQGLLGQDPTHPNGLIAKGGVSFVFKPGVLARTTYAPMDFGPVASDHGSMEDLDRIALGRILRDHHVVQDDNSTPAFDDPAEATPQRLHELLGGPAQAAVSAFKDEISRYRGFNAQLGAYPPMIEAEVRAPSMDDVQEIVLEPIDPLYNPAIPADIKGQIIDLASKRGIPVVDRTAPAGPV